MCAHDIPPDPRKPCRAEVHTPLQQLTRFTPRLILNRGGLSTQGDRLEHSSHCAIETRPALLYIIRKRTFGGGGGFPRLPRTAIPRLAAASSPRADLPLATQLDPLARGAGRRAVHEAGLDVARDRVEGLLHVDRVLGGGLEET